MMASGSSRVEEYLHARWGEPARSATFWGDGNDVSVSKWDSSQNGEGVTLYVTSGASVRVCDVASGRRIEFVLGFMPEQDDAAKSLAMLAGSVASGSNVDRGHTVTLLDEFWPGSQFYSFMILPAIEPTIPLLRLDDGTHVEFLEVMPLYGAELELKKSHSAEWVMGEFNDRNIVWSSPTRSSL